MKVEIGIDNVVIKGNKVNLCDSCRLNYPTCPPKFQDIAFGDGKGNDNVCMCSSYIPVAYRQGYKGEGETK